MAEGVSGAGHEPMRLDDWKPGEVRLIGRKLYGVCGKCGGLIRINKPILGSLHVCDPDA